MNSSISSTNNCQGPLAMGEQIKRILFGAAFIGALALAFIGYLQPSFIVDLANRIILCF